MQKHIKYHEFFNFFLLTPAVILEGFPIQDIIDDMLDKGSIPISYVTDKKNPFYKGLSESLQMQGLEEPIKLIVLSIEYNKQFLA